MHLFKYSTSVDTIIKNLTKKHRQRSEVREGPTVSVVICGGIRTSQKKDPDTLYAQPSCVNIIILLYAKVTEKSALTTIDLT